VRAYLVRGRFEGMKILRVYIDTSVIGGCFDVEFAPWSNGLMQDFRAGHFRPVLSEVVAGEIRAAPEPVRVQYAELLRLGAEFLAVSDEALDLAAVYEARGILAPRFRNDMLHIALQPWQTRTYWLAGTFGMWCGSKKFDSSTRSILNAGINPSRFTLHVR
jgi:hypothetical protein